MSWKYDGALPKKMTANNILLKIDVPPEKVGSIFTPLVYQDQGGDRARCKLARIVLMGPECDPSVGSEGSEVVLGPWVGVGNEELQFADGHCVTKDHQILAEVTR